MKRLALIITLLFLLPLQVSAAPLYSENFDVDPTASWTVNGGPTDETANFFFDYSTVGIPSAPNSVGTTPGLKLQANLTTGVFGGFSVSPTGQHFAFDYRVRFDWWSNFNGPFPVGGNGSTNLSTFGIGTVGNAAQVPGSVEGILLAATGDGGSASDWRTYSSAEPTSYASGDSVYAAPSTNNSDPYYAGFGQVAAPAAQVGLFPLQTGDTAPGSAGMAWHEVEIAKIGADVTWTVDGLLIATLDLATILLGGDNIFFGHSDTNSSSSSDPNDVSLLFTLIDNIVVVPEPGSSVLFITGAIALCGWALRIRRGRSGRRRAHETR